MITLHQENSDSLFYATQLSAGFDLTSAEEIEIPAGEWRLVDTGVKILETGGPQALTVGGQALVVVPELQIRPRSGLAAKYGVTLLNTPGTIDADYRGPIKVNLINHGKESFFVRKGDRIAQGVCALVTQLPEIEVKQVIRGTGGFGSTGN